MESSCLSSEFSDIGFRALAAAERAHRGHRRKVVPSPYLRHVLNVQYRVLLHGFPDYPMGVAALLHDTVEHGGMSLEQIESEFGGPVAALVDGVTAMERHEQTWQQRKLSAIVRLRAAWDDVVSLACADKIDNLQSIREDAARLGDEAWRRLGRSRAEMEWYFRALAVVFGERADSSTAPAMMAEFNQLVQAVFGSARRSKKG